MRYNFLTKTEGWMNGWKGKLKDTVTTKRKSHSPTNVLQEDERGGINAKKKWRRGENEANVGGYSMYTQRHLILSSTFKHQQ